MSLTKYIPDSTKIIHNTSVDFMTRSVMGSIVHLVQYDKSLPIVAVKLYSNGSPYVIPENMDVNVRVKKPDHTGIYNPVLGCNEDRTIVYVEATEQFCAADGEAYAVIEITNKTVIAASGYFYISIDKNPVNSDDLLSSAEGKSIAEFVNKSQSYAVGGTGTRAGEDTDNAKYYYDETKSYADTFKDATEIIDKAAEEIDKAASELTDAQQIIKNYQNESKSYAVGGTGTRAGEDTDNSKYYYTQLKNAHFYVDHDTGHLILTM